MGDDNVKHRDSRNKSGREIDSSDVYNDESTVQAVP